MKTLSVYTTTMNALFWQTTIEETIMSALQFADEIVVVDGGSTDGTIELIEEMTDRYGSINLIIEPDKYDSLGQRSLAQKKSKAALACTGKYCMLLDADEVVHEGHMKRILDLPNIYPAAIAFNFQTIHFYRSWNRFQEGPGWYEGRVYMWKNKQGIHHGKVGRDRDQIVDRAGDSLEVQAINDHNVSIFHYGWCRNDAIMQMKKRRQEIEWWGKDYWKKHTFPLKFDNPLDLPRFNGTHPSVMQVVVDTEGESRWIHEYSNDYRGYFA